MTTRELLNGTGSKPSLASVIEAIGAALDTGIETLTPQEAAALVSQCSDAMVRLSMIGRRIATEHREAYRTERARRREPAR
jgi:hypothetical protein